MPITYDDFEGGEARDASSIPSSRSDVLWETFAQAYEDNPLKAISRWNELDNDEKTGPRLDAKTARQQLKDAGFENDLKVGDAGITQAALDTLMERKTNERRRGDILSRAQGGLVEGTQKFGLAIATTLADPVSAGLNFVPIVGQTRYYRWLAGASFARRAAIRVGVGAIEGTAGAAIAEVPIYAMRTSEQADFGMGDALLDVAFGGVTGAGLHTTVGSLGDLVTHVRGSIEQRRTALRNAAAEAEARATPPEKATFEGYDASPLPERAADYHVQEGELTDEQLAAFQGLRSELPRDENVRGPGEGAPGQPRDSNDGRPRGEDGPPLRVFRGAERELTAEDFSEGALGHATGHPSSGLGVFFTNGEERAAQYGNVTEHVLDVRNPKVIPVEELPGFDSLVEAAAFRRALEKEGFDGIVVDARHLGGPMDFVAFAPQQVFKASEMARVESARARITRADPSTREAALRAAVGQAVTGEPVNVDPIFAKDATSAVSAAAATQTSAPNREFVAATKYADETIANVQTDRLKAAQDEAALAIADATALQKKLGIEEEDAELAAAAEGVKTAERWAKAAEIASTCLLRGG